MLSLARLVDGLCSGREADPVARRGREAAGVIGKGVDRWMHDPDNGRITRDLLVYLDHVWLVRVRRAVGKPTQRDRERATATGAKLEARFKGPKSKHGKRDVPLSPDLVGILRRHLRGLRPDNADSLAFPSANGTPLRQENVRRRYLHPATSEAGAAWAGFHTFRHTFASLHIAAGTNVLVLSRLLGHHSPEFTLSKYAHLIPGDAAPALDLAVELAGQGDNNLTTDPTETDPTEPEPIAADAAV